jgi:hypothetical protein
MKNKTVAMQMMILTLAVLCFAGMQNEVFGAVVPAGDRHFAVNMVYPENSDDTGAIIAAIDFIFRTRREAFCQRDRSIALTGSGLDIRH